MLQTGQDTNIVENTIRPLALNRKNALFAGHDEGAAAWAGIASLVETAKMNQVNPHAYLKATLEAIAAGHPASDIDALMSHDTRARHFGSQRFAAAPEIW